MILKLMGISDLFSAIALILLPFGLISWKILIISAIYLLLKAYLFKGDFASMVDGASALYMVLTFFGFSAIFTPIFGVYLFQKSFYSLF